MAKILLVEDDLLNREMMLRRLKWEGYEVIVAIDGAQGVDLARSEHPDLILMDIGLPVLNGWQATHRIKTNPATSHIPIIALTAYALAEDRTKSMEMGCDEYEVKPVNFARLLAKINALISNSSPRTDQAENDAA